MRISFIGLRCTQCMRASFAFGGVRTVSLRRLHSRTDVSMLSTKISKVHAFALNRIPCRKESAPSNATAPLPAGLSAEDEKRLKVLKLEYDVFMSTGVRVPDKVTDEEWLKLLNDCKTISARKRYYTYLYKIEKTQLSRRVKSEQNALLQQAKREAIKQLQEEGKYSFKNTFLLMVQEKTMNRWYYNNLCYALMNGPHLIFDFSYENQMTEQELNSLLFQVLYYICF
jgi:hypothetical protein